MKKRLKITLSLFVVFVLLLTAYFVVNALNKPEEPTRTPLETLFPGVGREEILAINVENFDGEQYKVSFETLDEGTSQESQRFVISKGETLYTWLEINPTYLSELLVSLGKPNIQEKVLFREGMTEEAFAEEMKGYGLSDGGQASYTITCTENRSYHVIIGNKNPTGQGHFFMLEGGDYIASSSSLYVQTCMERSAEEYVYSSLVVPNNHSESYAFPGFFAIYENERMKTGAVAEKNDFVRFVADVTIADKTENFTQTFRVNDEGDFIEKAFYSTLLGITNGICDKQVTFTYPNEPDVYGTLAGQDVRYNIKEVVHIQKEDMLFAIRHFEEEERPPERPNEMYFFLEPEGITSYLPHTMRMMESMQKIMNIPNAQVVCLGLDETAEDTFGTWKRTIVLQTPNIGLEEDDPYKYITNVLYISSLQQDKDGRTFYYVGSRLFDLVARVDASALDFLENALFEWVEPQAFIMPIDQIEEVTMEWSYGDALSGRYRLVPTFSYEEQEDGSVIASIDKMTMTNLATGEKTTVKSKNYREFIYQMYYINYRGDTGFTDAEEKALLHDPDKTVLKMTMQLKSGVLHAFRFVPYSQGKCMIWADGVADFYIYNVDIKTLASNFLRLQKGETVNAFERY